MKICLALTCTLALCTLLSGCATPQPVTQIDKDTYLLVASSRWHGNDGVAAQGVQQADEWCRQQGRSARITGSERSEGLFGVLPPKVMLSFKCDRPGQ
ncbi:hypothetical protein [Herbaspirillum rubrisubalbicans]|uniref:Lipoprotein n=1 Tax=Herbaspirillum rubrisubalbicans TaxID=80842 RepID=A0AAD0UC39_9BURK|nr:hypothetical protein [Herbaspirillum rubrisubalbicans]AYR26775.1 hypothetical protein RC54_24410 [Herbaspirillum rubrisubalbicans]